MNSSINPAKKKVVRKHILQQLVSLYLNPVADSTIKTNLKSHFPFLLLDDVRELAIYLKEKDLIKLRKNRSGLSLHITANGIDVIDGAIKVRGVEKIDLSYSRLEYKKEIRRFILSFCYSFQEFYNEDTEIQEEFRESGFSNLLLEEIRFHVWYLSQKSLLDFKTFNQDGDQTFMCRITAKGIEVAENNAVEPGVTENGM